MKIPSSLANFVIYALDDDEGISIPAYDALCTLADDFPPLHEITAECGTENGRVYLPEEQVQSLRVAFGLNKPVARVDDSWSDEFDTWREASEEGTAL